MNLGELEFKAEDFDGVGEWADHNPDGLWSEVAGRANRILREKLEKAPVLFGHAGNGGISFDWGVGLSAEDYKQKIKTHMAKFVCIEPISKEEK